MTTADRLKLSVVTWGFTIKDWLSGGGNATMKTETKAPAGKIYDFKMKTIDGKEKSLADYKGRVLLVVNVASKCGFTPQYENLETLHKQYKDKGLSILGFPANEFGAQEPGTDAEIKTFCSTRYNVDFDMFSKIVVKGPGIHPLYQYLTQEAGFNGDIPWNFSKFLVDRQGRVAARYAPQDDPLGKKILGDVERLLAA